MEMEATNFHFLPEQKAIGKACEILGSGENFHPSTRRKGSVGHAAGITFTIKLVFSPYTTEEARAYLMTNPLSSSMKNEIYFLNVKLKLTVADRGLKKFLPKVPI